MPQGAFFIVHTSDVTKKQCPTCSIWIFLKRGHFWWKRSWKLKNQRKKPKQKHLCSHHCFFLLLLVVYSDWHDFAFRSWRSVCILSLVWLKLLRFLSQGLLGHVYLLEKTTPLSMGASPCCSGLSIPLATEAPGAAGGFFVSSLPQVHMPIAWRWDTGSPWSYQSTPSHLRGVRSTPCGSPMQVPSGLEKLLQVFRDAPSCQLS